MFVPMLALTFVISAGVCGVVDALFRRPIAGILARIVVDEIHAAWTRYLRFALYVVGISSGVSIRNLEQYVTARWDDQRVVALTAERLVLEVYRTMIETLQGAAWMLLVFFVFALVAYVIVRAFEIRRTMRTA